jgi:hypothetical protein
MSYVLGVKVGGEGKRKLVLIGYANHAGRDGANAWCSIKTVADYAECSERTTQRHVKDLLELGFMREGNQLAPIGASAKPANQLPIVYDIAIDDATRERWRATYTPGRREKFAEAGALGGRRSAENRRRGDSVTPLRDQAEADFPNETSQVKRGDNVTPPENADDRGDISGSSGVTESLFGGDTVMSPEPSLEPSLNRPRDNTAFAPVRPPQGSFHDERPVPTSLGCALLDEYVRTCQAPPPRNVRRRIGEKVDELLADGYGPELIRRALQLMRERGKWPELLPDLVNELINPPQGARRGSSASPRQTTYPDEAYDDEWPTARPA